jgi:hypothetical protein
MAARKRPAPTLKTLERLRGLLLRAVIDPPSLAPPEYNDACLALWDRLLATRTLPTAEEFVVALDDLSARASLASFPDGVTATQYEELLRVSKYLAAAATEALVCGLTDGP